VADSLLTLHDIVVRYGAFTALEIKSLEILRGELLAIIGPNGAGKSTLVRVIGLLQPPNAGSVLFDGAHRTGRGSVHLRRRIATVFQEPLLLNATVYQNATLGLRLRGFRSSELDRRIVPWLERLGIAHLRQEPARNLSGGEAQRTSLARALALAPELLLLDEPFAALDPTAREVLLRDFQDILQHARMTTVLVTHDREEAVALASRVGVLKHGHMLQIGTPRDVFLYPNSESVAEMVGIENRWAGTVKEADADGAMISVGDAMICAHGRFQTGARVVVCLRSEDVTIDRAGSRVEKINCLEGTIVKISQGTVLHRLLLDCGGVRLVALLSRTRFDELVLAQGITITAQFSSISVHVVPLP
jgi:tungstate transport system ATP-binding protein